jgi:membrane-associated phospholipid phosphatase
MTPFPALSWQQQIAARLGVLSRLKAVGTMTFMALFFWAYFAVLRNPPVPPLVMPLTAIDAWVPFTAAAFPVYASLWVYVSIPPALIGSLRALAVFGLWIAALCLFCLAIFWFFPTAVPTPAIDWTRHPEMAIIKGLDASGNACPSLHVASAVFSALWLDRLFARVGAPVLLRAASVLLCLAILWSTMATRQHVFVDVFAGALAGALFAILSLRHARAASAPGGI